MCSRCGKRKGKPTSIKEVSGTTYEANLCTTCARELRNAQAAQVEQK